MIIKITFDPDGPYGIPEGQILDGERLVNDYIETLNEKEDADTISFIKTSEIEKAVDFVAEAWNLEYDIITLEDIRKTFDIRTPVDVGKFFFWIVFEKNINFHPDDPFSSYSDGDDPTFSPGEESYYDEVMKQCFEVCETYDRDIYKIAMVATGAYCYCDGNEEMASFCLGED